MFSPWFWDHVTLGSRTDFVTLSRFLFLSLNQESEYSTDIHWQVPSTSREAKGREGKKTSRSHGRYWQSQAWSLGIWQLPPVTDRQGGGGRGHYRCLRGPAIQGRSEAMVQWKVSTGPSQTPGPASAQV